MRKKDDRSSNPISKYYEPPKRGGRTPRVPAPPPETHDSPPLPPIPTTRLSEIKPPPNDYDVSGSGIWEDVDQARRAWAMEQACRQLAGMDACPYVYLPSHADAILAYVLTPRT